MEYRLGQYECGKCGRVKLAPTKAVEMSSPVNPVGGGRHDPGAQYRQAPLAADGHGPGGPSRVGASVGSGQGYPPQPDRVRLGSRGADPFSDSGHGVSDTLRSEKNIYLGLQVGGLLLILIGLWTGADLAQQLGAEATGNLAGLTAGLVIGGVLGVGLIAYALYSEDVSPKWACFGCNGFGLLTTVGAMLFGEYQYGSPLVGLAQVAISLWFLSILFRDIQNIQRAP
jgi:hypothetical protein